ncbi:MAG: WD40/YVTN/BNR-like repeat-containing protein, partial [Gemmataceae bacterium]
AYASGGHTLTALAESPLAPGLLFAGSDDGRLHRTRDGGQWEELTARLPGVPGPDRATASSGQITRVEPSPHDARTFYVALDRHRQDDCTPHLFRTRDGGRTFDRITAGLPAEGPVHVVRADPRNRGLLFAGTEFGLYASFDGAFSWQRLECGVPPVAVHDLIVHPAERELVVATHGRGIWVVDVAPLQDLTARRRAEPVALLAPRPGRWPGRPAVPALNGFAGQNPPPGAVLHYRLAGRLDAPGSLQLRTKSGEVVRRAETAAGRGLHAVTFDLTDLRPGEYAARLTAGGRTAEQTLIVPPAPNPVKPAEE